MIKKRIVIGVVLLMMVVSNGYSQPFFYSQYLRKMYYSLPEACRPTTPVADTVIHCSGIIANNSIPVVFCWDEYEILEHIGYRFFNIDEVLLSSNSPIIRFLERELLTLLTTDNLDQKLALNSENGLMIAVNGNTPQRSFYRSLTGLPHLMQHVSGLDITYEEGRYRADIQCGAEHTLNFQFVADAELLSDMDKKERDDRITSKLSNHKSKTNVVHSHHPACSDITMKAINDSIFVCEGISFIIPQINNNLYYTKTDGEFLLVFGKNWIVETLSNVLLATVTNSYTMQITQRMYGGEQCYYELNSSDFNDFFSDDYERYFGIETTDRDILTGTLLLLDKNTRNIHLGYVTVTVSDLLYGGSIKMVLNANIPLHNVETIFSNNINK